MNTSNSNRPIIIPVWGGELNEGSPYQPGYVAGDNLAAQRLATALAARGQHVIFFCLGRQDSEQMIDGVRVIHRKNNYQSDASPWNREAFARWMLFYLTRYAECLEDLCWQYKPKVLLPRPLYPHGPMTKVLGDTMGIPTIATCAGFDYLFFFEQTRKAYLSCGTATIQACAVDNGIDPKVAQAFQILSAEIGSGLHDLISQSDRLIVLTQAMTEDIKKAVAGHCHLHVIPDGVDLSLFNGNNPARRELRVGWEMETQTVIGCVARLDPDKRQDLLIEAMGQLADDFDKVGLVLGGDGQNRHQLEERAKSLGIEDRVRFLGRIAPEKVPDVLSACDIVACASDGEGLCLAMLEGMAAGKPILASNVPPFQDFITEDRTGWLADNTADAYARSITHILTQNGNWTTMGQAAKIIARRYTWQSCAEKTLALIETLES